MLEFPTPEKILLIFSPNKRVMPKKPMMSPVIVDLLLKLTFHIGLSSRTNQKGAAETRMATSALGKTYATRITTPVPPNNNNIPVMDASHICFALKIFSPNYEKWSLCKRLLIHIETKIYKSYNQETMYYEYPPISFAKA